MAVFSDQAGIAQKRCEAASYRLWWASKGHPDRWSHAPAHTMGFLFGLSSWHRKVDELMGWVSNLWHSGAGNKSLPFSLPEGEDLRSRVYVWLSTLQSGQLANSALLAFSSLSFPILTSSCFPGIVLLNRTLFLCLMIMAYLYCLLDFHWDFSSDSWAIQKCIA